MDRQEAETTAAADTSHFIVARVIAIVITLTITLLSSLIPLRIVRHGKAKAGGRCQTVVEFCQSIGGGVFLGTCFTGLFPFARKKLASLAVHHQVDYPLAECLLISGFFFIAAIERLTGSLMRRKGQIPAALYRSTGDGRASAHDHSLSHQNSSEDELFIASPREQPANGVGDLCHNHVIAAVADPGTSLVRGLFVVAAVGLHAAFEGLAVGLQTDMDLIAFANLLLSVLIHESLCSFATGLSVARLQLSTAAVVRLCVLFSVMLPGGMVVGIFLGRMQGPSSCIASGILQGIATGTLLYVLFIEMVPATLNMPSFKSLHLLCMLLGCAAAAALAIVMNSHHGAGGNQHCSSGNYSFASTNSTSSSALSMTT